MPTPCSPSVFTRPRPCGLPQGQCRMMAGPPSLATALGLHVAEGAAPAHRSGPTSERGRCRGHSSPPAGMNAQTSPLGLASWDECLS